MTGTSKLTRIGAALAASVALLTAVPAFAGPEDELLALLLRADEVKATGIGPTTVFVSWLDRSPVDTLYRIEASRDEAGPYTEVATYECATALGSTSIRIPQVADPVSERDVLCATQFQYGPAADPRPLFVRVVPLIDVAGITVLEGLASRPDPALLGPVPPSNLQCNGGGDTSCLHVNSVTLTWQDNSDEAEFWIMRARGSTNPDFGTSPHAVVPANVTTYHEFLTEYSTTFWYRVAAVRRQNIPRLDDSVTVEESYSNSFTADALLDRVKVETAPVPPPTDPTGLTATFSPPSTATLTWTDKEFNPTKLYVEEDGWFIDWGRTSTSFDFTTTKLPKPGQGATTFIDDNIPPDTLRCYRVRGWRNGPAYSGFTNVTCVGSIPSKPANLVANALDNATVKLNWTDRSDAETSFAIQRCNGTCSHASSWTDVGTAAADATMFLDTSTLGNTTYSYRVFAENSSGRSAASNIATVTTPVAPVSAPTNLVATATGSHEITVTWIDTATSETGFRIEYKDPDGNWAKLTEIGPKLGTGNVTHVDTLSLAANQQRCYRVRALKVNKVSDPSNTDCATTFGPAAPNGDPSGLTATPVSNVRIDLTWTDNATNEDNFRIEVIAFPNLPCPQNPTGIAWKELGQAPKKATTGLTSFAAQGLQPHTAHFFRVIAVNKDGESNPSNTAGCAQTFGPAKPIFLDPAETGDVEATRCKVDIKALAVEVDRVKLIVNAWIPETGLGHTDVVWVEEPLTGSDTWRAEYKFRRGITYRLIAQSQGHAPDRYLSATAEIRDVKVLADCPLDL